MSGGGQLPTSQADVVQQQVANQGLQNFSKTELPALGYQIKSTKENEPALETMAAGQASGTAREAEAGAVSKDLTSSNARGVTADSGATVSKLASAYTKGAGIIGESTEGGTLAAKSRFYNNEAGIIGEGNQMQKMADKALVTAGGVTDSINAANQQANDSQHQEAAGIGTAALMLAFA